MAEPQIDAVVSAVGLSINGSVFNRKLPLERYQEVLGPPSRTIDAGPPAPAGHRNNQVHIFGSEGIYLTEHHTSRLIESVNFVFDSAECLFPIEKAFNGSLKVDGQQVGMNSQEGDLDLKLFRAIFRVNTA